MESVIARRCTSVRRFRHRFANAELSATGPIEFSWDDGSNLTLDARADWTLEVSGQSWKDPYADASIEEQDLLAVEVGLWEDASALEPAVKLVGQTVSGIEPELNEVGELFGLRIVFDRDVLRAWVNSGELSVTLLERR